MRELHLNVCLAAVLSACSVAALAQGADSYPSRPVTVIIPYAPGASAETETRLYTVKMAQNLGRPFIHDFKPGAGASIGTAYVAKSAPDGYILGAVAGGFNFAPAFYVENPPYDPVKDFAPIALMSKRPTMFLVGPSLPVNTMQEYIAYARANPGKINFATTGQGASYHIVGAWLHGQTNTQVTFIHYKGGGPLWVDMLAGRVNAAPVTFLMGLQFVKSGKLRPIANMGLERSPFLPDLRTMEEQGFPGFDYPSWAGYVAPAATPAAIVAKLNAEFVKAGRSPDVIQRIEEQGGVMVASTPDYFRKVIVTESARWKKVVQDNNIKSPD